MQFTNVLLEKLTERNMTQAELCRITGIPSSLMSAYVANKKSPALSNAIAIANAFNITLDELVGRGADLDDSETNYDPEVAEMLNKIHKDPDLRILFDASEKLTKKDLEFVIDLVKRMSRDGD